MENQYSEADGFFPPDSLLKRTASESVGLLGGGRALLMQLAHPLVACGVTAHSDLHSDPLGRLDRTLDMMLTLIVGNRSQAEAALRRFHAIHAPIYGHLSHAVGSFSAGASYSACDPSLQWWVLATLIDTRLITCERFITPLSQSKRAGYYNEAIQLAYLMGIPATLIPPTLAKFHDYMQMMVNGDVLIVTDAARALAAVVLAPNVWIVPRPGARLVHFVTAGLLPDKLRDAYGLVWNARKQGALDALSAVIRALLPLMPDPLRYMPVTGQRGFVRWALKYAR